MAVELMPLKSIDVTVRVMLTNEDEGEGEGEGEGKDVIVEVKSGWWLMVGV